MAINNEKFTQLLGDAKAICTLKLNAFKASLGEDNAELNSLNQEATKIYESFADPKFLVINFNFDELAIRTRLQKISLSPKGDFPPFRIALNDLLEFLNSSVLAEAQTEHATSTINHSAINQRILEALSTTNTQLREARKSISKKKNIKLKNDPRYKKAKDKQKPIKKRYRTALEGENIKGIEDDLLHIRNCGAMAESIKEVIPYLDHYTSLTTFMEKELETVAIA